MRFAPHSARAARLVLILSILCSILPGQPAVAAPLQAPPAAPPAEIIPWPVLPITIIPPEAESDDLPASEGDGRIKTKVEDKHILFGGKDAFDGTFSTPSITTYTWPDAILQENVQSVEHILQVPAGIKRDSLSFNISITNNWLYGTGAHIATRLADTGTWSPEETVFSGQIFSTTSLNTQVTLNSNVPLDAPMEIRLRCDHDVVNGVDCTWSNLRLQQDVLGWKASKSDNISTTNNIPANWGYTVGEDTISSIGPIPGRGSFLGIRTVAYGYQGAAHYIRSPLVTLPQLESGKPFNASVRWSQTFQTTEGGYGGGFSVNFLLEDSSERVQLLGVGWTESRDAIPWTLLQGTPLTEFDRAKIERLTSRILLGLMT
jgi:hypothetical protein